MTPALIFKFVVVVMLIVIFVSLTSGLVFLIRDRGRTTRTARSLTVRIVLSIALFILLIIGFATGLIQPHGLPPAR